MFRNDAITDEAVVRPSRTRMLVAALTGVAALAGCAGDRTPAVTTRCTALEYASSWGAIPTIGLWEFYDAESAARALDIPTDQLRQYGMLGPASCEPGVTTGDVEKREVVDVTIQEQDLVTNCVVAGVISNSATVPGPDQVLPGATLVCAAPDEILDSLEHTRA